MHIQSKFGIAVKIKEIIMKKKRNQIVAIVCAFVSALSCMSFVSCGKDTQKKVDKSKAQLHVSNYDGGVGHDWLDAHIARFEEAYKDYEFIPGKKGVQVWVTNHKNSMAAISGKLNGAIEDVYFLEHVNYYDMISQGNFMDITDLVATETLSEYGENVTIESKLHDKVKEYLKTSDGKYYALPHTQSPTLITYDADLFNRLNLYFDENGVIGKKSTDSGLSKGVDGVPGTYDDGLPATYEEFYMLCAKMKQRGVAPMIWSGMYDFYMTRFSKQLRVDFEGAEQAMTAYDFNGTMTHIVDTIDDNGNITYKPAMNVTEENGYEMLSSAGYYYAFKFFEGIVDGEYYSNKAFNDSVSHEDAQETFLLSSFEATEQDIGMLVEGLYWVNEAKGFFKAMEAYPNASLKDRNLKVMPLPKATKEQIGQKTTLVDSLNQLAFISAYVPEERIELAKTFLKFCSTQASLEEFVVETGLTRNYRTSYDAIYDTLTPYSQSVVDLLGTCDYILPASSSPIFQKNFAQFYQDYEMGTSAFPDPMVAIKNDNKTAIQLFNEFRMKFNEKSWAQLLQN